ncbi:hypothetical protein DL96DRAFT_1585592 [Flagelloscypha sp. PMI_526]|nr:hypothetical protein DL96DRAFT_1585592 [Flagelloscypha sp. PMI_526]
MNNLALTFSDLGRHSEALDLREKIVRLRKQISGPEHPHTLTSMHNLAVTYSYFGRHPEGLDLMEHVLELRKRILGLEHPHTLLSQRWVTDFQRPSVEEPAPKRQRRN